MALHKQKILLQAKVSCASQIYDCLVSHRATMCARLNLNIITVQSCLTGHAERAPAIEKQAYNMCCHTVTACTAGPQLEPKYQLLNMMQ